MERTQRVREYVFGALLPTPEADRPGNDANLFDLGLDSLRLMKLLVFVEEAIDVVLPDHEVTPERVETIDALMAWVDEHRSP